MCLRRFYEHALLTVFMSSNQRLRRHQRLHPRRTKRSKRGIACPREARCCRERLHSVSPTPLAEMAISCSEYRAAPLVDQRSVWGVARRRPQLLSVERIAQRPA